MRVVIAVVILAISIPLNGCSRPQQAVYVKPLPSSWVNPQSRPRPPKLIKASSVKPSQPSGKPRRPIAARSPQPIRTVSEPAKESSVKPPHVSAVPKPTKASSAEPPPPQRKPEQPPINASVPSNEGSEAVEHEAEAKFRAVEAKAKREGVDSLTREDIEGLTPEQLKELRGY
jgi:hypothetical protein